MGSTVSLSLFVSHGWGKSLSVTDFGSISPSPHLWGRQVRDSTIFELGIVCSSINSSRGTQVDVLVVVLYF